MDELEESGVQEPDDAVDVVGRESTTNGGTQGESDEEQSQHPDVTDMVTITHRRMCCDINK